MTSSIPSGFSSDDLKKMLENAMPEPEAKESHTCGDDCEFGDNDRKGPEHRSQDRRHEG